MNMFFQPLTSGMTLLFVALAMSAPANADTCDHIDLLARDIQTKARLLMRETPHYRNTPNYRQLVVETSKLYQLASHVRTVAHLDGNLRSLEADLRDLECCFDRLEDLYDVTEYESQFGRGCIRGNTAHVKRLLIGIEDCIHQMQDDVSTLRRALRHQRHAQRSLYQRGFQPQIGHPTQLGRPAYSSFQPHPYTRGKFPQNRVGYSHTRRASSGIGFSIGGGSSRIELRF